MLSQIILLIFWGRNMRSQGRKKLLLSFTITTCYYQTSNTYQLTSLTLFRTCLCKATLSLGFYLLWKRWLGVRTESHMCRRSKSKNSPLMFQISMWCSLNQALHELGRCLQPIQIYILTSKQFDHDWNQSELCIRKLTLKALTSISCQVA